MLIIPSLKLCHSMEMVKSSRPAQETSWTGQQCPSPFQLATSIGRHDHCQSQGGHGSWQSRWKLAIPPESDPDYQSLSYTYGLMILSQQVILNFC